MIIVQLSGGFGNQLFQYAAGLSLAEHHNVEAKVDVSLLLKPDKVTGTTREVDIFNLASPPREATKQEVSRYIKLSWPAQLINKSRPFYRRKVYKETSNLFDNNFFKASKDLLLKGNRQSEKYFKQYEQRIRNDFSLSEEYVASVKQLGENLRQQNSISVHIRRGDYLTPVALKWLGVLSASYYYQSISTLAHKVQNCKFYIFSDDIEWTKQNLKIDYEHEFISRGITKTSYEDFYLMSKCKHNIIANSTFSWWAAWLNSNPDKIVIAPKKWYNQVRLDTSDLIPDSWIKL